MRKINKFFIAIAAMFVATIGLASCDDESHEYSTVWNSDSSSHWHDSVCEHNTKSEKSSHTWTEVSSANGTKTVCSVCGREKKENATYEVDEVAFTAASYIDNYTIKVTTIEDGEETNSGTLYHVSKDKYLVENANGKTISTEVDSNQYLIYSLGKDETEWSVELQSYDSISSRFDISSIFEGYSDFEYNSKTKSYKYSESASAYGIKMDVYALVTFENGKLVNALYKTVVSQSGYTGIVTMQLFNVGTTEAFEIPNVTCYEMNSYTFESEMSKLNNYTYQGYSYTIYCTENGIKEDYDSSWSKYSSIYEKNGDKYYYYYSQNGNNQYTKTEITEEKYNSGYAAIKNHLFDDLKAYYFYYDGVSHKYVSDRYNFSLSFENLELKEITPLEGSVISNIGNTTFDIPNC